MAVDTTQNTATFVNDATTSPLLHELQLGEQLNECVQQTRRADFSLMLAMLAEDVREHSQFSLPKTPAINTVNATDEVLRKQFQLPKVAPLALKNMQEIVSYNQAETVLANDLATIHLINAISPKPLAFRDNKQHVASEVMNNTSVHCQIRTAQALQDKLQAQTQSSQLANQAEKNVDDTSLLNHRLPLNVEGWLNGIQKSLVQAPLIN